MTNEEFQAVFSYLTRYHEDGQSQDWYLPYGFLPGSYPGGVADLSRSTQWRRYQWNPPEYLAHLPEFAEPDPLASPKPDWSVLVSHIEPAISRRLRPQILVDLKEECRQRITRGYGEQTYYDELNKRLRNEQTTEQDEARDYLRARYQALKIMIEDMLYSDLKTFNVKDSIHWVDRNEL